MTASASDDELALLAEADYVAYVAAFAAAPGVSFVRTPTWAARRGDYPDPYLNLVVGAWTDEGGIDAVIREATDTLALSGRPYTWSVWPSNRPASVGRSLVAAGFVHEGDGPLMTLDLATAELDEAAPAELTVEPAEDRATFREASAVAMSMIDDPAAAAIYAGAYEAMQFGPAPTMRVFLGRVDGRVVATSALYWGTGCAGIYGVGTLEAARGRGYGRAVTAAALREGRRRGLRTAALLSSELGLPVYRGLGFRAVGSVGFYGWPGSSATPAS